jgi:hypothetical protein
MFRWPPRTTNSVLEAQVVHEVVPERRFVDGGRLPLNGLLPSIGEGNLVFP